MKAILFMYIFTLSLHLISGDVTAEKQENEDITTYMNLTQKNLLEFMVTTRSELKSLKHSMDELKYQNEELTKALRIIRRLSKEALFQKYLELVEKETERETQFYIVDDDSDEEDSDWYLREAAEAGHPVAQFRLGVEFSYGSPFLNQSDTEAAKWYMKAAIQNQADAQCYLAIAYHTGRGVTQSNTDAMKWYRRAASQNHPTAQNNLGWLLLTGGVTQEDEVSLEDQYSAFKLFLESARSGDAFGIANVGLCYTLGINSFIDQNLDSAFELYQAIDEYDIGRYSNAAFNESPKWRVRMMKWFQLAADRGDRTAMAVLDKYNALYAESDAIELRETHSRSSSSGDSNKNKKNSDNKLMSESQAM